VRTRRALFDALIRTRTPVPLTELLPYFDQFPAAVIAIVAKNNPRNGEDRLPLLLKAEEQRNAVYWYAAIALVDREQLVHYLIQQARFDYSITVTDQDFLPVQVSEGPPRAIPHGIPGGVGSAPKGSVTWPDSTIYHIELSGDIDGNNLLTSGPLRNTYLKAWSPQTHAFPDVQDADPLAWEDHDREVVRVLLSIAHCAACQRAQADFPNIRGGRATIVWHSAEQTSLLLEDAVEGYVRECIRMLDALHETALSNSEIRAKVRIWLRDQRTVKTVPISNVDSRVEFNRCAPIQSSSSNGRCTD